MSECKVVEEPAQDKHTDSINEIGSNDKKFPETGDQDTNDRTDNEDTTNKKEVKECELKVQPPDELTDVTETPFYSAVNAIFQNWTALQLIVSQGAAGSESANIAKWMVTATVQWFSDNEDLECYEVEDFLLDIINQEFNVQMDDGSEKDVSKLVCEFYKLSSSPKYKAEFERRFQELPKCDLTKCQVNDQETSKDNHVEAEDNNDIKNESEEEIPTLIASENNGQKRENHEYEPETRDSNGPTAAKRMKM